VTKDKKGVKYALAVSKRDMYFPSNTSVYSLYATKFNNTSKSQMFSYDSVKDTLSPHTNLKYVVTSGVKHNLYVFYDMGLMNQKFHIDKAAKSIYSEFTKRKIHGLKTPFKL
jgi:hypothetical protein